MRAAAERLLPAATLALAACSGGDGDPPADPNLPLDRLCAAVAAADCARLSACEALTPPFDEALCQARQAEVLCAPVQAAIEAAVASRTLDYFELAARDCADAVEGLGCEVGLAYDLLAIQACRDMVSPAGAAGDPCHLGFVCGEGLYCDVSAGTCPGRCAPLLGNNRPCTFGERCAADLYCDLTQMRCLGRTDLGGTCGLAQSGSACVDGTFCDRSNPADPVCARARGRNEGCNADAECVDGRCIGNRCSAGLEGDACADVFDCTADRACVQGRCRAPLALDAACGEAGPPCGPGLTCTSTQGASRCRPRPLLGEAGCDPDRPCYLSRCEAGTCAAAVADGAACIDAADCLPGRACEAGRCAVVPRSCRR